MSSWFFVALALLDFGAAISLVMSKNYALSICFMSGAVANTASLWIIK